VVGLDETVSWVEQNRRAASVVTRQRETGAHADPLKEFDRQFARYLFKNLALEECRPLVGLHPAGGRPVKQWALDRWHEVASRLQNEFGATILVTGSKGDGALAQEVIRGLPGKALDLTGRLSIREALAVIGHLDLFLSPDTGPMHMACATGTPSVSVFGPSDPVRYFSGDHLTPGGRTGSWHVVARKPIWCSPCNLIRKPPEECLAAEGPECLRAVTVRDVFAAASRLLREGGFEGGKTSRP
jgi:ADP-heptose:LPS heptosyltransferase